jgi:hypothetical protein
MAAASVCVQHRAEGHPDQLIRLGPSWTTPPSFYGRIRMVYRRKHNRIIETYEADDGNLTQPQMRPH